MQLSKLFQFLVLITLTLSLAFADSSFAQIDYLTRDVCQGKRTAEFDVRFIPSAPANAVNQRNFGTCFGGSAHYLLQDHYFQTKAESDPDATLSFLDVLGKGCQGRFLEGGYSFSVLDNIRRSLRVAIEPYPASYLEVYKNLAQLESDQCIYALVDSCLDLDSAAQLAHLLQQSDSSLAKNIADENLAYHLIDRLPSVKKVDLAPFNLYVHTTEDAKKIRSTIQNLIEGKSGPSAPVSFSYCMTEIQDKCDAFHTTTVVGTRTACCDGQCHHQWYLHDSIPNVGSGWFMADSLIESAIKHGGDLSYIRPCTHSDSNSKIERCQPTLIGSHLLHHLAKSGDFENISKIIIEMDPSKRKEKINEPDLTGITPIEYAAEAGYPNIIELLAHYGGDLNFVDRFGTTALEAAILQGKASSVKMLLKLGADKDTPDQNGLTPFDLAMREGRLNLAAELVNQDAQIDLRSLANLFVMASRKGNLKVVQLLIDRKIDINVEDDRDVTALAAAIKEGHFDMVALLLRNGAKIEAHELLDTTPLNFASALGDFQIVDLLLKYDPKSINALDLHENSALIMAVQNGNFDIVKLLVNHQANVNQQALDQTTALMVAAENGHTQIARYLLENGADPNLRNRNGNTAFQIAKHFHRHKVIQLLLSFQKKSAGRLGKKKVRLNRLHVPKASTGDKSRKSTGSQPSILKDKPTRP